MPTVTLSLLNLRHAPWGLLTDEEIPQTLVWLTEESPVSKVESEMLTDWDVTRIIQSCQAKIISAEGLEGYESISETPNIPRATSVPITSPLRPKVASSETIMDVTQLMRNEAKKAQVLEEKIKASYPKIDELLSMPATKLKKELKELAKGRTLVSFFQECRKKELEGKDRKTVIAVLVEIIQTKINQVSIDGKPGGHTGQTALSNAYYDMIEEFEDEDEEVEITVPTKS